MRRIIISSSGFSKNAARDVIVATLPPRNYKNIAYITTAAKVVKHPEYAQKELNIMKEIGYKVDEIDLADVTEKPLESRLNKADLIYVQGGNPYWLLKKIRESGFSEIIPKLIDNGKPYVGKSAGAYILAPQVLPPTWYSKEWKTFGVDNLTGLNVVNFIWAAHFDPRDMQMRNAIKRGIETSPYPVRVITNDQGFLIEGDKLTFFGKGNEHVLDPRSIAN